MFTTLPAKIQTELLALAVAYGQPLVEFVEVEKGPFFDPLSNDDRIGEVCMVIRRPSGTFITAKKTMYPPDCHRLLTGGIEHGEAVRAALLREVHEETGLTVRVTRFLAAVA